MAEAALKLEPENPRIYFDLFQAHFLAKRYSAAMVALDRAAPLDRGYGAAYLSLAQLAVNENQLDEALKLLGKAAPLFPLDPTIPLKQAMLLLDQQQPEQAQALLKQLIEADWSPVHKSEIPPLLDELQQAASQMMEQQ